MLTRDRAVYITANGINKTLRQAIIDGDIGTPGGGGGLVEVFNHVVLVNGSAPSLTGLSYFMIPQALTLSFVKLQVYSRNGVSVGNLTVDIKKNTTPDSVGMTSIFSAQPSIPFASSADYASSSGVLSVSTASIGDYYRLDITSLPAQWVGKFQIAVYGS